MDILKKTEGKDIVLIIGKLDYRPKEKTGYVSISNAIKEPKENIIYVDAITATRTVPPSIKDCIFVSSPEALTEIRLAIKSIYLDKGSDIVIVDNLTDMRDYNDPGELNIFLNTIVAIARENRKKLILIVDKHSHQLINDIEMFSDIVVQT